MKLLFSVIVFFSIQFAFGQIEITIYSFNTFTYQKNHDSSKELIMNSNEENNYYVDSMGSVFFLLNSMDQLEYYLNRNYTDIDLVNNVSQNIFYIIDESLQNDEIRKEENQY